MNILIDTNVLIDVLKNREPFYPDSASVWALAEKSRVTGYISAISFNNIYYIHSRHTSPRIAKKSLSLLRDIFTTVALDARIINQALDSDFKDFEDAIQYFSAVRVDANCIISRNLNHYKKSDIPVMTPTQFLSSGLL